MGALLDDDTLSVAHGIPITSTYSFTRIYGAATDQTGTYIPLPFVSVSGTIIAGNIELYADETFVYVTTTGNGTNFTICYVVLEYIAN
jgi:hypothetical protein